MKHNKLKPIVSVVICTYNGEVRIRECLRSLLSQDVPKSKFEIIVVDDGSSDDTYSIAKTFSVKVIRHKTNKGLSAARNTGLRLAKGEIYICFDDDCFADVKFIREILNTYSRNPYIAGACGFTKNSTKGIIDTYLNDVGHGNPSPLLNVKYINPLQRLWIYLQDMYSKVDNKSHKNYYIVNEIWGENCSFKTDLLKKAKGWNENLSGVEDTDLCKRLRDITGKPFICNNNAIIYHDGSTSYKQLIKKPFTRSKVVLTFYMQNHKLPPLFPFPLMVIFFTGISMYIFGITGLLGIIVFPLFLYAWWVIKFMRTQKIIYLLFPYIQCSTETSAVVGELTNLFILLFRAAPIAINA